MGLNPQATRATKIVMLIACFVLSTGGWAQSKYKVLHDFGGGKDGQVPSGPLLLGKPGDLYGATGGGPGNYGYGTIFELTRQPNGQWQEKIIHDFTAGSGGAYPQGGLLLDSARNLYGTVDGYLSAAVGGVFELSPSPGGWSYRVLYSDNAGPGLVSDKFGNLYGEIGPGNYFHIGAIGKLSPGSHGWTYTDLANFNPTVGYLPPAPPIWDGKGNMFGTTTDGGIAQPACWTFAGCGVIFEMTPNQDGSWTYHILHRFASYTTDGQTPWAGLVMDNAGNF